MINEQNIINEIMKMNQQELNTTAIAFLITNLKDIEKRLDKIEEKLKAYEQKENL